MTDEQFNEFWALWPNRKKKIDSRKAFDGALKIVQHDEIVRGVRRYLEHLESERTERKYIPLAGSWLRAGCWDDEYAAPFRERMNDVAQGLTTRDAKRKRLEGEIERMVLLEQKHDYSLATDKSKVQAQLDEMGAI